MTRRGPVPGTTGRTPAAVATVAIEAYALGRNMAQQVAAHFGCTLPAARAAISRARRTGQPIPYDYGFTADGVWRQCGGIHPGWELAVLRAARLRTPESRRWRPAPLPAPAPPPAPVTPKRAPRTARKFNPPRPTGRPHHCTTCGHTAATGWELAGHTLDAHGRPLTATERTPQEHPA